MSDKNPYTGRTVYEFDLCERTWLIVEIAWAHDEPRCLFLVSDNVALAVCRDGDTWAVVDAHRCRVPDYVADELARFLNQFKIPVAIQLTPNELAEWREKVNVLVERGNRIRDAIVQADHYIAAVRERGMLEKAFA